MEILSEQLRRLEIVVPKIMHRGELVGPSANGKKDLQRMQAIVQVKAWAAILCHQCAGTGPVGCHQTVCREERARPLRG